MKLNFSPTSPYARKVMVMAWETNLANMIDCIATDAWDESTGLREKNPLSKLPVLETDDGMLLFDSTVICAYLDTQHGGQRLIPVAEPAHWQVLRIQAVADGIMDAAFLSVSEVRKREEGHRSEFWLERQAKAIRSGIKWLDEHLAEFSEVENFAPICAAVALAYVEFRLPHIEWRSDCPALESWFDEFSKRNSMQATIPA